MRQLERRLLYVRNGVDGQDEIGQRPEHDPLGRRRSLRVAGGIPDADQLPGEGDAGRGAPDLGPEPPLDPDLIDLLDGRHEGAGRVDGLVGRDRFGIRGHGG